MAQSVFRVHLIPYGGEHTRDVWGIFDLCVSKGIIGVGWAAPGSSLPSGSAFEDYARAHTDAGTQVDQSVQALKAMRKGDLAWIRDPDKRYYLAEVRGPWEYRNSPLHRSFDIMNVRQADIWQVDQSQVPTHVATNAFPRTVQRIANSEAVAATIELWRGVHESEVFAHVS